MFQGAKPPNPSPRSPLMLVPKITMFEYYNGEFKIKN